MPCLLSGWTKRNKPRVLNGWAVKRYSASILPYLAEKLTEQGFITFLQRLTHALRQKITHMHTVHLQVDTQALICIHRLLSSVWVDWFSALKKLRFCVYNCWQTNWGSSSQVRTLCHYLVSLLQIWERLLQHRRVFVMSWEHETKLFVFDKCFHCVCRIPYRRIITSEIDSIHLLGIQK